MEKLELGDVHVIRGPIAAPSRPSIGSVMIEITHVEAVNDFNGVLATCFEEGWQKSAVAPVVPSTAVGHCDGSLGNQFPLVIAHTQPLDGCSDSSGDVARTIPIDQLEQMLTTPPRDHLQAESVIGSAPHTVVRSSMVS